MTTEKQQKKQPQKQGAGRQVPRRGWLHGGPRCLDPTGRYRSCRALAKGRREASQGQRSDDLWGRMRQVPSHEVIRSRGPSFTDAQSLKTSLTDIANSPLLWSYSPSVTTRAVLRAEARPRVSANKKTEDGASSDECHPHGPSRASVPSISGQTISFGRQKTTPCQCLQGHLPIQEGTSKRESEAACSLIA